MLNPKVLTLHLVWQPRLLPVDINTFKLVESTRQYSPMSAYITLGPVGINGYAHLIFIFSLKAMTSSHSKQQLMKNTDPPVVVFAASTPIINHQSFIIHKTITNLLSINHYHYFGN